MKSGAKSIDLGERRLIAMRDVQDAVTAGATSIVVGANSVVTPSARDFLQQHGIELVTEKAATRGSQPASRSPATSQPSEQRRRQSPAVFNARGRGDQERNLLGGPQAVDAPVR